MSAEEDKTFHRVHWVTPLAQTWKVLAVIAVLLGLRGSEVVQTLTEIAEGTSILITYGLYIAGGVLGVLAIAAAYCWLAWRNMGYALDEDYVEFKQGILFTSHRKVPYDRVQSCDLAQPLFARIFGLGVVTVVSAGNSDAHVRIGYLSRNELNPLRDQIEARVARARGLESTEEGAPLAAREHSALTCAKVETKLIVGSELFHLGTWIQMGFALTYLVAMIVAIVMLDFGTLTQSLSLLGPPLVLFLAVVARTLHLITDLIGFTVEATPQGLRTTRGLLNREVTTLPVERIHGIVVKQDLLWRFMGWWRVEMIVAGGRAAQGDNERKSLRGMTLLPVASAETIADLLGSVVPLTAREASGPGLLAKVRSLAFEPVAPRARLLNPFEYRYRGVALTSHLLLIRSGWLTRTWAIIDRSHIQSVRQRRGPLQRWRTAVSVEPSLVPTISLGHALVCDDLTPAAASALADELRASTRRPGQHTDTVAWYRRVREERGAPLEAREPADLKAEA